MPPAQHFMEQDSEREQIAPRVNVLPWICSGDMYALSRESDPAE
jgi:hypothetical protein